MVIESEGSIAFRILPPKDQFRDIEAIAAYVGKQFSGDLRYVFQRLEIGGKPGSYSSSQTLIAFPARRRVIEPGQIPDFFVTKFEGSDSLLIKFPHQTLIDTNTIEVVNMVRVDLLEQFPVPESKKS